MIWALKESERIKATPQEKAICPSCNSEVISKCGDIKVWHWSHKSSFDCDDFSEPESEWHLNWKNYFPKEWQEVCIKKCKYSHECIESSNCQLTKHRADIKTKEGLVIELQNSPLSSEDIIKRENFYKNMIWILNGETLDKGLQLKPLKRSRCCNYFIKSIYTDIVNYVCKKCNNLTVINYINDQDNVNFRWKNPPKSWWSAKNKIYIHLGYSLVLLKKIFPNIPCGGYGKVITIEEFLKEVGVNEI